MTHDEYAAKLADFAADLMPPEWHKSDGISTLFARLKNTDGGHTLGESIWQRSGCWSWNTVIGPPLYMPGNGSEPNRELAEAALAAHFKPLTDLIAPIRQKQVGKSVDECDMPPAVGDTLYTHELRSNYTITVDHGSGPHVLLGKRINCEHYEVQYEDGSTQRISIVQMYRDRYVSIAAPKDEDYLARLYEPNWRHERSSSLLQSIIVGTDFLECIGEIRGTVTRTYHWQTNLMTHIIPAASGDQPTCRMAENALYAYLKPYRARFRHDAGQPEESFFTDYDKLEKRGAPLYYLGNPDV